MLNSRNLVAVLAVVLAASQSNLVGAADDATKAAAKSAAETATPAPGYRVGDRLSAPATTRSGTTSTTDYKLTAWEQLVPKDWDPLKDFRSLNLGMMSDGDPRAMEALERLKREWDNAPTEASMNGERIRIAGFIVPLEGDVDQLREFLLVPYFGACIHVPPPPANQTIHVKAAKPVKGVRMMDAVWVSGQLLTEKSDTRMGASGYRMNAQVVAPYK
jgi:hypothetical protein